MPPTQITDTAVQTSISSVKPPTHHASIPAMVILALILIMMAALVIGVILRQRKITAALRYKEGSLQENERSARTGRSWLFRLTNSRPTAANLNTDDDYPSAVGALHATSVLLAAAPCQVFSAPMTMHFRIPLQDKTILILGTPWFPAGCGAQYCNTPACDRPETWHQ